MRGMAYAAITALVLLSGAPVWAQQPGPGHGPQPPGDTQPMGGQSHMMHMHMCREMMGMMPMGMMSMMSSDPKQPAEMMAMRGEMMKAMGDIMTKYAERMRTAK